MNEDWLAPLVAKRIECRRKGEADARNGVPYDPSSVPSHNGTPLKFYLEAYDFGYQHPGVYDQTMEEFVRVETVLHSLPTRTLGETDL